MTSWLQDLLRAHPEIAFFLVLGIGYLIGRIAIGGFKIGAVTGTLLAGVIVGQLGVTMSDQVKQCFFLLFLFAIGFRTGPQFFRGLRSDGLGHAALAAIVAIAGVLVAYGISLLFDYDADAALRDPHVSEEMRGEPARVVVTALAEELAAAPRLDRERFRAVANQVKARTGQKGKALFHPIRLALTGRAEGP